MPVAVPPAPAFGAPGSSAGVTPLPVPVPPPQAFGAPRSSAGVTPLPVPVPPPQAFGVPRSTSGTPLPVAVPPPPFGVPRSTSGGVPVTAPLANPFGAPPSSPGVVPSMPPAPASLGGPRQVAGQVNAPPPAVPVEPSLPPLVKPVQSSVPPRPEPTPARVTLTQVTGIGGLGFHGVVHRVGTEMPAGLNPFEAYLLSLMDGVTNVDDIVAASGLGVFDAAVALRRLKMLGLIRFSTDVEPVKPREEAPAADVQRPRVGLTRLVDMDELDAPLANPFEPGQTGFEDAAPEAPAAGTAAAAAAATVAPAAAPADAVSTLLARAREEELNRRPLEALILYEEATRAGEVGSEVHHAVAMLHLRTAGASPVVLQHLERALALDPDNAVIGALRDNVRAFLARGKP